MNKSENISTKPTNDQEYPWHQKSWQHFISARTQNYLPHAILLSGEEGIGKLPLAKRMAKSLLCMNTVTVASDACNQCQSCKTYESEANPDYIEIALLDDKKQIGVDQIRALSQFLNYSRSYNTYRVVIINPVERMNLNAANSLLKSLEEPTSNTVIILVSAKVSELLATIKSRCQLLNVTSPSKQESLNYFQQHQNQSTENNTPIDINILYEMVGSKPLHAHQITQENIDHKYHFFDDLDAVIKHQISISDMAKKWEKHDVEVLINWQIYHLQNNIKTAISVSDNTADSTLQLTQHLNPEEQWNLYHNLIKQKQYIHTSVNCLMFLENMIMLWMKVD